MKVESIAECSPWENQILVFLRVAVLHRFDCINGTHQTVRICILVCSIVDNLNGSEVHIGQLTACKLSDLDPLLESKNFIFCVCQAFS